MITSHELQKKMMDVIFDNKVGGKRVTVVTDNGIKQIADFVWCPGCYELHITLGEFAPDVSLADIHGSEVGFRGPGYDESI